MFAASTPLRQEDAGVPCFDRLFSPLSSDIWNYGFQTLYRGEGGFFKSSILRRQLRPLPIYTKEAVLYLRNLHCNSMRAPHKNSLEIKRIFLEDFPMRLYSQHLPSIEHISVKDIYILLNECGESYKMPFSLAECYKLYHKVRSLQALSSPVTKTTRHTCGLPNLLNSGSGGKAYYEFPTMPFHFKRRSRKFECSVSYTQFSTFDESQESGLGCSFGSPSDPSSSFYEPIFSTQRDVLRELHKMNCYAVTSQLLSYLSPEDIQTVSSVSKTWRGIVLEDVTANKRRCEYLIQKKLYKENKSKAKPKETTEDRVLFLNLANTSPMIPKQPLEKSANTTFQSFVEVGKKLNKRDLLLKCPNCKHPSKRELGSKYCCTRQFCAYEFCCECFGPYLDNHTCNKPNFPEVVPEIVIGSPASKRSLRRL